MKPLLVGETNPYYREGAPPDKFALYPLPKHASGHNLATKVMGLSMVDYLRLFDRANLCKRTWSIREAREKARNITDVENAERRALVVLCGQKVCNAFGFAYEPLTAVCRPDQVLLILPHPSGLCRFWNEEGAYERARAFLRNQGVFAAPAPGGTHAYFPFGQPIGQPGGDE